MLIQVKLTIISGALSVSGDYIGARWMFIRSQLRLELYVSVMN